MNLFYLPKAVADGRQMNFHTAFKFFHDSLHGEVYVDIQSFPNQEAVMRGWTDVVHRVKIADGDYDDALRHKVLDIVAGKPEWAGLQRVPV